MDEIVQREEDQGLLNFCDVPLSLSLSEKGHNQNTNKHREKPEKSRGYYKGVRPGRLWPLVDDTICSKMLEGPVGFRGGA